MSNETETLEDKNLKALGAIKSNYDLIDLAASQIENRLLLDDETANDNPASFMNIFLENFGRLGSQSFYEQMMYKNEMLPSTAIKLRSIVNKLDSDDIQGIYAYPSRMTFVIGYEYDALIEAAKKVESNSVVINKECIFSMEGMSEFTLDSNIIIKVIIYNNAVRNIYAIYDTSDRVNPNSNLSEVNNIYITSQIFNFNGKKIFGMFVNGRQMKRTVNVVNVTNENPDFKLSYTDQLYGFEMTYKSLKNETFVFKSGKFDGNINPDGYNFAIDTEEKTIDFSFNRTPSYWKPSIGDTFKITVYTTKGKSGNFTIPNIYEQYDLIKFEYGQNRDIVEQDIIVTTNPYVSIKDAGSNSGRDSLSFEEIRSKAINRGSISKILSPGDLETKANELGFATNKIRSDVRCLEYRAKGVLKSSADVISSINSTIQFNFADFPINSETSNRTLNPKTIYEFNKIEGKSFYKRSPEPYSEYFTKFRENIKNQYMFPYHIRFSAGTTINASVFNMNRDNDSYSLNFLYYNDKTTYESSILNIVVNRDPITEDVTKLPNANKNTHTNGFFDISFQVTVSSEVAANIYSGGNIVKYKVLLNDGNQDFLVNSFIDTKDIDLDNNTIIIHAYINTDDAISSANKILARDYCIEPVPYIVNPIEYYLLPGKINLKIIVLEKNLEGLKISVPAYASVLTDSEVNSHYFVSSVYGVDDVILFEDYSDYINLPSDLIVNQKEYSRYESDVYKIYETDELLYDDMGNPITEIKRIELDTNEEKTTIDVTVSKFLHKKNSFVYKENSDMSINSLAIPISILTGEDIADIKKINKSTLSNMIIFDIAYLNNEQLINYIDKFLNLTYIETEDGFLVDSEEKYIKDEVKEALQNKLNEYREKITIHSVGEINQESALLKDETYSAIIKYVPLFDRIYAIGNGYDLILSSYSDLIANIKALQSIKPDGATISLGIKNTAGAGEYEVYNMNSSTWETIDNIALSFDIGVKYSDSATYDEKIDNDIISKTIREYINTSDAISININSIFAEVKAKLTTIEYMILYKINQYPASQVQSIRKKDGSSIVSDKLSVKAIVDIDNTDIENESVNFKPDIIIRTIS